MPLRGNVVMVSGCTSLGFERTVACVRGLANVRDVIPFPRTPGKARY